MKILTGSVLALLVGGVAYMNIARPGVDRPNDVGEAVSGGSRSGARTPVAAPPDFVPLPDATQIVPALVGAGDARAALERIPIEGPGALGDSSAVPVLGADGVRTAPVGLAPGPSGLVPFDRERDLAAARGDGNQEGGSGAIPPDAGSGLPQPVDSVGSQVAPVVPDLVQGAPGELVVRATDSAGTPLDGIGFEITATQGGTFATLCATDAEGVARVADLAPGSYRMRVLPETVPQGLEAPWYAELCRGASTPHGIGSECFTVPEGGAFAPFGCVLVRAGAVAGLVTGRDGEPASDAMVRLVADGPGLELCRAIAQTDSEGLYTFVSVPGKYRLEVTFRPDGANAGAATFEPRTIVVFEGETTRMPTYRVPGVLELDHVRASSGSGVAADGVLGRVGVAGEPVLVPTPSTDAPRAVVSTFQLRGRIVIADEEFEEFKSELAVRIGRGAELDLDQTRRAYLRGLRLEQRAPGVLHGRSLAIHDDGTFEWSCTLPRGDVEFVLEARGLRTGGRRTETRLVVTPAADRTMVVELPFPAPTGTIVSEGPTGSAGNAKTTGR